MNSTSWPRLSRRAALGILAAAGASSCAPGTQQQRPIATPDNPVAGGVLRVSVGADPASMQPWQYSSGVDRHVLFTIYDPIITLNLADYSLTPGLAREWTTDASGEVVTLHLQQNVRFHDGTPLQPEDVIFSIEQAQAPEASRTSGLLSSISKIRRISGTEIELVLDRPDSELFSTLADVLVAKANPDADYSSDPVGTGPYVFDSWQHGRSLAVTRNPNYWKTGHPYPSRIEFKVVSDQTTALMQLQNRQADVVDQVSFSELEQARRDANIGLHYAPEKLPNGLYELFLNTRCPPFSDVRVRQALSYAIDRPKIEQILPGVFRTQSNPVPQTSLRFDSAAPNYNTPDAERTQNLLAEAGYADGVDCGTLYVYSDLGIDYIMAAQTLQYSIAEAGFRLSIQQLDVASWADQVLTRLDYTIALGSAVAKPTDYDLIAHTWSKALGPATGWSRQNELDRQLRAARSSTDGTAYDKHLQRAQRLGMTEQPIIVLGGRYVPVGVSPRVQDFIASPQGYLWLHDVWIAP